MTQVWGYQFQGQELRVVCIQTDTLRFVLEDVCNILELDVWSVVSRLQISDINRAGIEDEHGFQVVSLVSVAGLYQVVALSKKEVAEPFLALGDQRRGAATASESETLWSWRRPYVSAALTSSQHFCCHSWAAWCLSGKTSGTLLVASFLGVGFFKWLVRDPSVTQKQELPRLGYAAVVFGLMATFWWPFIIK